MIHVSNLYVHPINQPFTNLLTKNSLKRVICALTLTSNGFYSIWLMVTARILGIVTTTILLRDKHRTSIILVLTTC